MEHGFYEDNEYVPSLPAEAERAEDFEYEVRPSSFMILQYAAVEGFGITKKSI